MIRKRFPVTILLCLFLPAVACAQCAVTYNGGFPNTTCAATDGTSPGMMLMAFYYYLLDFGSLADMAWFMALLGF